MPGTRVSESLKSAATKVDAPPGRILVADDEATLRGFLSDLLKSLGHTPVVVADGAVALERLKEEQFDLLITDLIMPNVSGLELLHQAREMDPDLVCIVLTGQGTMETAMAAIREMAYAYVTKPFDLDEFIDLVKRGLDKRNLIAANNRLLEELRQERESLKLRVNEATGALATKVVDLETLNRRLSVLYDIARHARGAWSLDESLKQLVNHLRNAIVFQSCFCFVFSRDSRQVRLRFTEGAQGGLSRRMQTAILMSSDSIFEVFQDMEDPSVAASRIEDFLRGKGFSDGEMGHFVLAPMKIMENLYGLLCLSRARSEPFAEADRQMLQIVAFNAVSIYEENAVQYRTSQLQTISELTSEIAHDLKHPLTNIKGMLQLASESWYDTERRDKCIEMIHTEIGNMDHLIRELTAFSRSQQVSVSYVDVRELIRKVVEKGLVSFEQSRIECKLDLDPGDYMILVNEHEMTEVFMNLIVNAVQAMPQGGGLIIRTRGDVIPKDETRASGGFRYVEVDIADTGVGIEEHNLRRIFDRFFTSKEEGTGLGLAIVDRIVKKNLGYVNVNSKVGVGTTFTVGMPLR